MSEDDKVRLVPHLGEQELTHVHRQRIALLEDELAMLEATLDSLRTGACVQTPQTRALTLVRRSTSSDGSPINPFYTHRSG
jgi:capsule polysaccharide export protein KpsE/RkpR